MAIVEHEGPFAVIVSDMRMPRMDGLQFLVRAKQIAPDSVRIMLTGNSDQQTAIQALNEGNLFRFLTKPCPTEQLRQALQAGVEQYQLVTAEKQLLEETLNNSLQVLVDILSLVNPTAFSRSTRVKRLAREIAVQLGLRNPWEVEIAAMLSQIGCITVPEETLLKIAEYEPLTGRELDLYQHHPYIGHDLIAQIPRLEMVAEIIAHQNRRISDDPKINLISDPDNTPIPGAHILKVVLDFDQMLTAGNLPHNAIGEMAKRDGWYDPQVLDTLKAILLKNADEYVSLKVNIPDLQPGMILDETLTLGTGATLFSAGQEITLSLILRLVSFIEEDQMPTEIQVRVPASGMPTRGIAHLL